MFQQLEKLKLKFIAVRKVFIRKEEKKHYFFRHTPGALKGEKTQKMMNPHLHRDNVSLLITKTFDTHYVYVCVLDIFCLREPGEKRLVTRFHLLF